LILKVKIMPSPLAKTIVFPSLRRGRRVSILEAVRRMELSCPRMMMKISPSSERKSPSPRDRIPEANSRSSLNRVDKTTIPFPIINLDIHYLTLVITHPVLYGQLPNSRTMLKTGMSSPIVLATIQHAIYANDLSVRLHASMMRDISLDLKTITIGWMTALTVTGLMTVGAAAPNSLPGYQKFVVITIKDPRVEVQLKVDLAAQRHQEVSVSATRRTESTL